MTVPAAFARMRASLIERGYLDPAFNVTAEGERFTDELLEQLPRQPIPAVGDRPAVTWRM